MDRLTKVDALIEELRSAGAEGTGEALLNAFGMQLNLRRLMDNCYQPELPALIDDYLGANPTRNRAPDCLPLFLHFDEQRVRAVVKDPRVKSRPTLHYRLPNSEIDRPDWGLRQIWMDWLQVECLAADPDRLKRLCEVYMRFLDRPLGRLLEGSWAEQVKPWLKPTEDL